MAEGMFLFWRANVQAVSESTSCLELGLGLHSIGNTRRHRDNGPIAIALKASFKHGHGLRLSGEI